MISTRKIFNQVNHINLRHLRTIELSATDSVRTSKMLNQSAIHSSARCSYRRITSGAWLAGMGETKNRGSGASGC